MTRASFSRLQTLLGKTIFKPFWELYLRYYWYHKFPNACICFNTYHYPKLDITVDDGTSGEDIDITSVGYSPISIRIGKNVFFGPKVAVVPSDNHTPGNPSVMIPKKYRLEIGDDVWIGYGVILLLDLKIGKGATIGAGAVVTHDVAPYDVVAGVPAKSIKK